VTSPVAEGPARAFGVSEATLLQMTGAYAGYLNQGVRATPYGMTELRRKSDGVALMHGGPGRPVRVLDDRTAGELVWMMSGVVEHGTGTRARLPDGRPAAGKTGTTQAARDAWFIGFTADYVCGVWMGYDNNTPLTGTTGGGLPAEIWRETMARIETGLPVRPLPTWTPERPVAAATHGLPAAAGVETAVRTVVQNVLQGLFGRN
jgi:membrane peptidoglycan carboxypeptidase